MIITREKGMRMWGGGSGSTSASGVNGGGGFSLAVEEGEGTGNAYTDFTYESGTLTLNKATEFVTVDFFNKLFTAYDANGNVIAPNNTTPTLDNIKFKAGAWTEQYLSALGQNSSGGGGGGGIELSDVWKSLKTNTDDYANQKINAAHIPDLSGTYATKTWVNQQGFVTSSGVTSVAMTVPTGLSVSGTPITTTGTLALTFANGYSIPTTAKQGNWDTAYGWGNHASAGYASASSVTTLQGYFTNGVAKTAAKLNTGTTTYTAWGQTYWSSGVPQSVSGNMTSVGSITPSANGNALGTTSARFAIYGTSGNYSSTLTVADAITLSGSTAAKKRIYFGDTSHYLELDSTGFHFSHGVYSDSFVSALGANSSGGGSGTFDEEAMWTALGTTSTAKVIASSHIPNLNASKITSGTLADARIPSLTASKITSGTFDTARIPNLSADKITSGTFAAARIPDLSGRYYALYGGTPLDATSSSHYDLDTLTAVGSYYCTANAIAQYFDNKPTNDNYAFRVWVSAPTGTSSSYVRQRFQYYNRPYIFERVSVSDSGISWGVWYLVQANLGSYALASDYLPLTGGILTGGLGMKFDTDSSRALGYSWLNTSGTSVASIIYHNTAQNIILNPVGSSDTWSDAVGKYSLIVGNNSLTYNTYPILHSNNYSSYALPLSGGTLTGTLYVATGYGITDATGNGLLVYKPATTWGGISSTQWGVGAADVQGVIRSNNSNLLHYKNGTSYYICDGNNTYVSNGVGYILGSAITTISGNSGTATTLATSRYIWGQSFNGSADIPTTAVAKMPYVLFKNYNDNDNAGYCGRGSSTTNDIALVAYSGNQLILGAGGSAVMYISTSNNVGIGTSSPSSQLHVNGSGQKWSFHSYGSASSSSFSSFYAAHSNGANGLWCGISSDSSSSSHYVAQFRNGITSEGGGGNVVLQVAASGKVGVGTESPAYALDVVGTTRSSEGFRTATVNGSYGFLDTRGSTYCYLDDYSGGYANGMYIVNSSGTTLGSAVGVFGTGNAISRYYYGGTWNNPLMTILPSGNVGIGVNMSEPSSKLAVDGTITCRSNYFSNTNPTLGQLNVGTSAFKGATSSGTTAAFGCYIWTDTNSGATKFQGGYEGGLSTNTLPLIFQPLGGRVRIGGNAAPTQALDVTGNILASGEITASSDERKKYIISNTKFNVKDIASARSIIYEWNDDRDKDNEKKIHGGSIAQDWIGKADSFLSQDNDGWYSINYGALALCSAITIAKEVVKHEDEITRLKKEVVKLRERVAELEERRVA